MLTSTAFLPYNVRMGMHRRAPLILGHRGYRALFPENTILAFLEALAAGAGGIECDLQKSVDGRYVVIHDPTTLRVTGTDREVGRTRLEELQTLDFGRSERIPTLESMLGALPADAYLDLELKEETLAPADTEPIAAILDSHRTRERLMISSFDPSLLFGFRRKGFTVGYLVGEEAAHKGFIGFANVILRLRPQFLNLPVDSLRFLGERRALRSFRTLRALGFSLLFWTVNSADEAALLAPHARIIVSDEVGLIVAAGPFTEN